MKALLICVTALFLMSASCDGGGECPECPTCPDDGVVLAEMPNAVNDIRNFYEPTTQYTTTQQIKMDIIDLQALINMCRAQNKTDVNFFLAAFTEGTAETYVAAHSGQGITVAELINHPYILAGTNTNHPTGLVPTVYAIRTSICPPPAACHVSDSTTVD